MISSVNHEKKADSERRQHSVIQKDLHFCSTSKDWHNLKETAFRISFTHNHQLFQACLLPISDLCSRSSTYHCTLLLEAHKCIFFCHTNLTQNTQVYYCCNKEIMTQQWEYICQGTISTKGAEG